MPGDIQKRTLLVVSDTAMIEENGRLLVFDPVLREMRAIEGMFDSIIWLGSEVLNKKPSLKPVDSPKIKTVLMPCVRRSGLINVLYILAAYPTFLFSILKYRRHATHVHTRGPSHPAFITVLLSLFDNKRIYSHKYAGEWTTNNVPFTYRIQRAILRRLRKDNIRITISGKNSNNNTNVYDLQNPCIYEDEIQYMHAIGKAKDFSGTLQLLFVGNMMPTKGIMQLLQALSDNSVSSRFISIHIVGGGRLLEEVKRLSENVMGINVVITGDISREELNKLYAAAHILILPSSSESFPKVIAESAAYGCIPVTTKLSAITKQVSHGENGFLMYDTTPIAIESILNEVAGYNNLKQVSLNVIEMSKLYTYERFRQSMIKVYDIPA